jgi:hypothetical protein
VKRRKKRKKIIDLLAERKGNLPDVMRMRRKKRRKRKNTRTKRKNTRTKRKIMNPLAGRKRRRFQK